MKTLPFILLLFISTLAFCTQPDTSENNMNVSITSDPHIATFLKVDAQTSEPDNKCWVMTYYQDIMIDRINPYESRTSETPINSIQFLLTDPEKQITQPNGAMHTNVFLIPSKYAAGETYQLLVECGASSCNMQNFTASAPRFYEAELMGINFIHSFALDPRYMINSFIVITVLGTLLGGIIYLLYNIGKIRK